MAEPTKRRLSDTDRRAEECMAMIDADFDRFCRKYDFDPSNIENSASGKYKWQLVTENVPSFYTAPPRRKPYFQSQIKRKRVECSEEEEEDKHEVEEKAHESPVKSTNSRRRRRCRRRKPLARLSQNGI
uniref:CDI domain-containing protein n=1 Tax=Mesocestoides corti TaxID=53468 RepID=A0A5K3F612_MESCO